MPLLFPLFLFPYFLNVLLCCYSSYQSTLYLFSQFSITFLAFCLNLLFVFLLNAFNFFSFLLVFFEFDIWHISLSFVLFVFFFLNFSMFSAFHLLYLKPIIFSSKFSADFICSYQFVFLLCHVLFKTFYFWLFLFWLVSSIFSYFFFSPSYFLVNLLFFSS